MPKMVKLTRIDDEVVWLNADHVALVSRYDDTSTCIFMLPISGWNGSIIVHGIPSVIAELLMTD
jgi:uncharacterized protein YlzI (FlbEa/FlbD family)